MDNQQNKLYSKIRKWLAKRFAPTGAVFSSKTVKDIIKKQSGLTPAELLRPFAEIENLNNVSL